MMARPNIAISPRDAEIYSVYSLLLNFPKCTYDTWYDSDSTLSCHLCSALTRLRATTEKPSARSMDAAAYDCTYLKQKENKEVINLSEMETQSVKVHYVCSSATVTRAKNYARCGTVRLYQLFLRLAHTKTAKRVSR